MSKLYLQLSCHYFATVLVIFCVIVLVIVFVFVFVLVSVIVPLFRNLLCHHLCHCWKFALAYWQSQEDIPLHRSESEDQGHWGQCITFSTPHHIILCNIFQYICIIFQYLCNIFQYFCDIFQYIQISMQYLCIASSTPPHICLCNIFHFQNRYWFVLVSTCIRICFDSYPVSSLHTTTNKSAWHEWRTLAFCVLVLSPVLKEKKYDEKGNTTATPKSITFARKVPAGFTPSTRFGFR